MADIVDKDPSSNEFFFITGISDYLGAGKNSFIINKTELIPDNVSINVHAYNSLGNELTVGLIQSKDAKFGEETSTGILYSVYISDVETSGIGYISINSTAVNLSGYTGSWAYYNNIPYKISDTQNLPLIKKPETGELSTSSVEWKRNIIIDTTVSTTSEIRFFDIPSIEITSEIYSTCQYSTQSYYFSSGSFYSTSVFPKHNHNGDFDTNNSIVYQIYKNGGDDFTSQMEGEEIRIKNLSVTKFIYSDRGNNNIEYQGKIDTDFIAKIGRVVNKNSLLLNIPFITVSEILNKTNQNSDYSKNDLTNIRGYVSNNDPDKQSVYHKKNFYSLSIESGEYEIINIRIPQFLDRGISKKNILKIELKNLRTLCGKLKSYKMYGRSLNFPESRHLISEGYLESENMLKSNQYDSGLFDDLGRFYSQSHVDKYWLTSSNNITITQSNDVLIDGAIVSHPTNLNESDYIIFKDNTFEESRSFSYIQPPLMTSSYWYATRDEFNNQSSYPDSSFIVDNQLSPYTSSQENLISGSYRNSNSIKLSGNSLYKYSMRIRSNPINTNDSTLIVYFLTGPNKVKIGTIDSSYRYGANELYENTFFMPYTCFGTIILVPVQGSWNISQISITPHSSVGYSPDYSFFNVHVPNSIKNELYEIDVELYDSSEKLAYGKNSYTFIRNKTFMPLKKRVFVDPIGLTLL
jgi:hypothetical protein